jgi:shikimate kinase
MNIVLIGFMGSGKSTVAKHLSNLLGFAIVEMDDLVYQKTNTRNMHEVFALGGELLLRETEIAIAKEYASKENLIISTGGGVVLNKIILDYFKKTGGKVIFLNARFEQIVKQLEGDHSRPLFHDALGRFGIYRNNLKNREFDQEAAQIFLPGESDIVQAQGTSEGIKFGAMPTQSKTDSSGCFGIISAKKLYDFRWPLYVNYADEIIDVDSRSIDEIAITIKERTTK